MNIAGQKVKRDVVIEIGKFAILWNRFENIHCNYDCNPSKIKKVVNTICIDTEKKDIFREVLKNRMEIYEENTHIYVYQGLYPTGAKDTKKKRRR